MYLFGKNPSTGRWRQEAYVKASNAGSFDSFGDSLALSADCDTLAVGAPFEGSLSHGIDPDPGSELAAHAAGAVYVFRRIGGSWNQEAYVKAPNADAMDRFGESVALSGDGSVLAVGAPLEDSAVTGILAEAPLDDDDGILNGAAYVFRRAETGWSEEAFVKGSDTTEVDSFGTTVGGSQPT